MGNAEIVLEIDGKEIPMNEFVRKILYGMIAGSLGALHGFKENWKRIDIALRR